MNEIVSSRSALETRHLSPSQIAMTYFIRASIEYPSSICAQGAAIALKCKQTESPPKVLMSALLSDFKAIEHITVAANTVHSRKKIGPHVDRQSVKDVIRDDFTKAAEMIVLENVELQGILAKYPFFMSGTDDIKEKEKKYREYVEDMITQRIKIIEFGEDADELL